MRPARTRQRPTVLLHGVASVDAVVASVRALIENTGREFSLCAFEETIRAQLRNDPRVMAILGDTALLDGEVSDHTRQTLAGFVTWLLRSIPGCDVVLVRTGAVVERGWLNELEATAYSDTTCATASALVAPSREPRGADSLETGPRVPPPAIRTPLWGAVYIRRDALDLIAPDLIAAADGGSPSLDWLARALDSPGLVHRLAYNAVVRDDRASNDGGLASADRMTPAISRALGIVHAGRGELTVMVDARCFDRPPTGTQVHILNLVRALAESKALKLSLLLPQRLDESLARSVSALEEVAGFYTVDRLPSQRPAIFHRPYQIASLRELEECRSVGERFVLTHQDMIMERNPSYFPSEQAWSNYRLTTAAALASADQVGFFSAHAAADAASDGALAAEKINVVPLGVDHADSSPTNSGGAATAAVGSLSGERFLLLIGNAYRHKNRLFALRLFRYLKESHGWDGKLVFAGGHPMYGCSVPDERAYLDANPAIRSEVMDLGIVGEGEKEWLYSAASLVLYPSLYEGFGLVPFESAAHGTACVYAWRSSLPEYLPNEGAILEGWDEARCAETVLEIMERPELASDLVGAINEAGSRLTWDRTAEGYLAVYRRALAGPSGASVALEEWVERQTLDRELTSSETELRLLDIYRRRRGFRVTVEGMVRLGGRATMLGRTIRRTASRWRRHP